MDGQIRRLAEAAESLELQARQLRAEIRDLAETLTARADEGARPEQPAAPPGPPAPAEAVERPSASPATGKPAAEGGAEGARLVALSMALDGKPREETAGHLREAFGLDDVDDLLDDVYARAGS